MAHTLYDSETANFSEKSLTLAPSDDLNYSKYWVNPCIDVEVLRGKKLRAQKLKSHPVAREYDVVDIDFNKPSCSTNLFQRNRSLDQLTYPSRLATRHRKKKRHKSPIRAANSTKRQPGQRKCPMRIAELAVPTKRHCIETWRNKGETLPSFMVERLRQIIMDEKPIVKINEAINYFKIRKPSGKPRSQKKQYPNVKTKNLDHIRILCAIFGCKITRKLLSPLNITLNPHLNTLSQIVFDELTLILSNGRRSTQEIYRSIQTEIADKVTIWIANILVDASYKLLLEDYQELEEEEGFVWEIIDDLVDNVVIISEPESLPSSRESTSISETLSDLPIEITNIQNNEHSVDNMETEKSDIVHAVLTNIVENVVHDENITTESPDLSKLKDTIELSIISNNITNKQMFKIITESHNKDSDMNSVQDAYFLELPNKENKMELQNERHIFSPSERNSNGSIDINKSNREELETRFNPNDIQLAKDMDNFSTPPSDYANNINEMPNKNTNNQSSDTVIDTDIGNTAKERTDINAGNIEQKKYEEDLSIILSKKLFLAHKLIYKSSNEDMNHAISTDDTLDSNHFKVANDKYIFAESSTGYTKAEEEMNIGIIGQKKNEERQSIILPENSFLPDEMINKSSSGDINHTISIDDTWDTNHFEVANDINQLSTVDTVTITDKIDENILDSVHDTASQIEAIDITPDDILKKVKRSNINIGVDGGKEVNKKSNNPIISDISNDVNSDINKISKDFSVHSNIRFAPPNAYLLNKADELWAGDLSVPTVKITLSVSKSVLSLGKITEAEEKYMTPPEEKDDFAYRKGLEPGKQTLEQHLQNITDYLNKNENKETEHFDSFLISEHSEETVRNIVDDNHINNDPTLSSEHPPDILQENHRVTEQEISRDTMDFNDKRNYLTVFAENPSIIVAEKNIISQKSLEETFLTKMTIINLPFININPKTFEKNSFTNENIVQTDKTALKNLKLSPIVEVSIDCGYSAYESSHKDTAENQINKIEVSKWCQGLENVINNLEIWSSWVENTCAYIMFLNHNDYQGRKIRFNTQRWIKLKTDVNLDAALWLKLSSDLQTGLLSYKNYYDNTRIGYPKLKEVSANLKSSQS